VLKDDPGLDVRLPGASRQPVRVVLDSQFRTPRRARLFERGGPVWLVGHEAHPLPGWIEAYKAEAVQFPGSGGRPDLAQVLSWLARREINEVHVEAGATLCGALVAAGLVDELLIYLAPHLMGSGARALFELPGLETMADRVNLEWIDNRSVGPDLRLRLRLESRD
jgi:diaminohydroxyphosphoribosylaminopyrimidine deaminase/5-amino-6-(5-phosphoribosylamino)uracil reductase